MGIDIFSNKDILFNDLHDRRVSTSPERNPTTKVISGLMVHSVFRRNHVTDDNFDGNPFIYALKKKYGYKIDRKNLSLIRPCVRDILLKSLADINVDLIVPIPSGHRIARYLAARASRMQQRGWPIADILVKRTIGDMLMEYEGNILPQKKTLVKIYKNQLRAWKRLPPGSLVLMKDVDNRIRKFFSPLRLTTNNVDLNGVRILLVDDLLSTGLRLFLLAI